jgi:hypothetical protein
VVNREDLTFTFALNQNNSNLGGYFPIQAHFYLRPLSILQNIIPQLFVRALRVTVQLVHL